MGKKIYIMEMSQPEVEELLNQNDQVIIPTGSIEQHGPHLPMGTDYFNGFNAARIVAEKTDSLLVPFSPIGFSPYHLSAEDKSIEPSDEELAAIPAELVQDLPERVRDAAEMGNVSALITFAEELKARSDACTPLSTRIVQLVEDFDFEGILKLADDLDAS